MKMDEKTIKEILLKGRWCCGASKFGFEEGVSK